MYSIDVEWTSDYKLLVGYAVGDTKPKTIRIRGNEPLQYIDDIAFYYLAPQDVALLSPYLQFRKTYNLATIIRVLTNVSRYDKIKRQSLADVAQKYLGIGMKHLMPVHTLTERTPALEHHCREDASVTLKLAQHFVPLVKDWSFFDRLETFAPYWAQINMTGLELDTEYIRRILNTDSLLASAQGRGINFIYNFEDRLKIDRLKFQTYLKNSGFNIPERMSPAPYAKGRLKSMEYGIFKTIGESAKNPDTKIDAQLIYVLLRLHYLQGRMLDQHHVYPFEIPCAQASGRCSAINSPLGAGSLFRASVIPSPGHVLVSLDVKAEEPRLAAHFSGDLELQEACKLDFYSYIASKIQNTEYEKLEKTDPLRSQVKNGIALPWLYGVGPATLAEGLNCEYEYARLVLNRLSIAFPTFETWKGNLSRAAMTWGTVQSYLHHYPLYANEHSNPRQLVNHLLQGTGADMLREMVKFVMDRNYKVVATLHDGLYIEVPLSEKDSIDALPALLGGFLDDLIPVFMPWDVECASV